MLFFLQSEGQQYSDKSVWLDRCMVMNASLKIILLVSSSCLPPLLDMVYIWSTLVVLCVVLHVDTS